MSFIVFEGPDGSGTSFHSRTLAEHLRTKGKTVLLTAEPTNGPIGTVIRTILKEDKRLPPESLQLLFCADRAWHQVEIRAALERGEIVISDRYSLSTVAYGMAAGIDENWLKELNKKFIQPERIILTLPPFETCWERISRRSSRDALEKRDIQEHVYAAYQKLAEEDPTICTVNTDGPKGVVSEQIRKLLP